jgi:hypothetical protein
MKENELTQCKVMEAGQYVCKQQHTLLSTATVKSCAVVILQKREALPLECDTSLVKLSHTVWTQLRNNTLIYLAPVSDTMTILCNNEHLVDVSTKGKGTLQAQPGCKGYSTTAILYGNFNAGNVTTQMKGDLISQVPLQYDCCEDLGIHVNLSKLTMDLAYKRTVSHLDNMKYATRKCQICWKK